MIKKYSNRYSIPAEEDFESDADAGVLKNFLGIKSKNELEVIEEQQLQKTELELVEIFDENYRFTSDDLCNIHELWLGDIYPFAGKYRTVNMSKGDFLFAPAAQITGLMNEFERKYLSQYTPCHIINIDDLAYALSVVHVEFILIHPFREGNGRVARLIADLMAMQARKPPINYAAIDQTQNPENFSEYILSIHAGLAGNYSSMQNIFKVLLEQSI